MRIRNQGDLLARTVNLVAGSVLGLCASCRSRATVATSVVPEADMEALVSFIKHQTCQPSTCDHIACEIVSDGQTKGLPSHVARCTWSDVRPGSADVPGRCAYVHYSADAQNHGFRNFFLSSPAHAETCEPDKSFSESIKGSQGYTGAVR